jgi:hypothetical protein
MKHYKSNMDLPPHPVYSESVNDFSDLATLKSTSNNFILLLAADCSGLSTDDIKFIARKLIDKGLAYILTWGPDCEKAHDAFDLANIDFQDESSTDFHIMSSWHSDESLEEAIWDALFSAAVTDDIWDDTSILCVSVRSNEWFDIIDKSLSNIKKFDEEMVNA